jgi:hypothetical protein
VCVCEYESCTLIPVSPLSPNVMELLLVLLLAAGGANAATEVAFRYDEEGTLLKSPPLLSEIGL